MASGFARSPSMGSSSPSPGRIVGRIFRSRFPHDGLPASRPFSGQSGDRRDAEAAPMSAPPLRCSSLEGDPAELVRHYLADPRTGWSVGTYGAIAEFQY